MIIQFANNQNQIGRMPTLNLELQKVVAQINASYGNQKNCDILEISENAQAFLDANAKETEELEKDKASGYQKYPDGVSAKQWAESALKEHQTGINTLSDAIDYEKAKLEFTISKINELENFLNGSGSPSDPNMTAELAETYLQNYKQSVKNNFEDILLSMNGFRNFANEYDRLSGGMVSDMIGDVLGSVTPESLGLDHLSDDPEEILHALENASKILDTMTETVGNAYFQISGGEKLTAGSWRPGANAFDEESFTSKMERTPDEMIDDTSPVDKRECNIKCVSYR